jgi:hypothetical protein
MPEEPGVPALPLLLKTVVLPRGARILGVRAFPRETKVVLDVGLVAWTQLPRPGQVAGGGAEPFFPPGPFVTPVADYLERARWPRRLAEVRGSSPAAGVQLATIAISPVEWRPRERRLLFHRTVEVEVIATSGRPAARPRNYAEAQTRLLLKRMLANPNDLPQTGSPLPPPPPHEITDAPYLIITDNHRWVPRVLLPGLFVGDMVGEFGRLASGGAEGHQWVVRSATS